MKCQWPGCKTDSPILYEFLVDGEEMYFCHKHAEMADNGIEVPEKPEPNYSN